MKFSIVIVSMLLTACVDPTTDDLGQAESEVGTGSAAGKVACWRPSDPNATCAVQIEGANGNRCVWNQSYGVGTGFCSLTPYTAWSDVMCDGPEDCSFGHKCCANGSYSGYGWPYVARCQATQCNPSEPTYDSLHVTLCHTDADCLPYAWRHCVPSGYPNHTSLAPGLGVCK